MAWISVHDHVVGSKLRELSKSIGCSQKEALGILVSLWLWGINNADKTGRLKSCTREDVAETLMAGLSKGLDADDIVASLIDGCWIDEESDGSLFLHDWDVWQEQWYKFLQKKEYDAKRKREERARKKQEEEMMQTPEAPQEDSNNSAPNSEDESKSSENPAERPMDNPKDEKPKAAKKRAPRKKVEKKQYAEFVTLTEAEYTKLVEGYGEAATVKFIEKLNLYKGSNGKSYKSDYMAILNWVTERVEKEYPGLIKRPSPGPEKLAAEVKKNEENPFAKWKEE